MGFRRVSYLKIYAIFCTVFILYLLTSEWENEGSILRHNRKLHKVLLSNIQLKKQNVGNQKAQERVHFSRVFA
jgi:hypothetical protein